MNWNPIEGRKHKPSMQPKAPNYGKLFKTLLSAYIPKYTDTGGIFDIMAVTVIQQHLSLSS